ncbi:protein disulfide-isomerase A6 homolog [Tigriopus californicus]|nr:protein disulfide-isomerase A6 homolog [Tigriopus californicus]XP_059081135.1 protein disulfide-isomerase A6 homolog [Tigriopus californicus]XP_059081136.1 protein disulfide-isomerase A6 homolog [Tigriopus californicus]|eukprot:TCALIF_11129-PA protein Name:"Similar to Pdia6 Protein disulfide-isomerase A6 (Rattus norvegicus)" AED:0.26 eAED:0.27 QI:0/-1/0/1/-1/1/1/0/437
MKMMSRGLMVLGVVMAVWAQPGRALYSKSSGVVELTPNNFDNRVKDSDGVWVVEFYAPWCGHCKQLVPEYQKAAQALKGIVGVGAVDCDQHKSLCGQYGVQGFPTIKVFGSNKKKPEAYNGARTAQGIVQQAQKTAESVVRERMGGKSGKSGSGGSGSKDAVIELTESNFKKLVLDSDDMWLVEFFAPWCGHCKNLAPEWAKAATELKGKVKLGAVDATVHGGLASQYGVQGYPTIKYFPSGPKSSPEEFDGGRTANDIVNWALDRFTENIPAPEVVQITNSDVMVENCEKKSLCVIAFLPHILDCQSKCRNDFIKTLNKLGDKFKKQAWGWVWAEGTAQPALEEALDIGGFGYPAMAVMSHKKMKYSTLTGSFGYDGIKEFLRDLSYGKGRTSPVKGAKMPEIVSLDPWDGKDGELPVEEDIDLSDVELDDIKTEL